MPRPPGSARPRPRPEPEDGAHESTGILAHGTPAVQPPLLFDRRRLARELGVSLRQVDSLRARGLLPPCIRLGRSVRWSRVVVEGFLAERQRVAERGARP